MTDANKNAERAKKERSSNLPLNEGPVGLYKTNWKIWNTDFEIDDRYTPLKAVGKGAYGTVCSANEIATGRKVAIKKIANCFEHDVDARRTLRECMLLRHLKHPNVVGIRELFVPSTRDFKDLYIVQDLMDTDLHQIIRSSQPLSNEHLQYFIYQILKGLKYIHSAGVLHRDLKPSNLLLTATCNLKICDFGLARTSTEQNLMTEYVVTRWYRAPELLLSCDHYSAAIDVWAVGCILAELLKRKPYFQGKDYMNQLKIIIMQLGMPSHRDLSFITNDKARKFISELGRYPRQPFHHEFPTANPDALDLLDRMLQFDPRQRISVDDALNHPYLATFRSDEPTAPSKFHFAMEDHLELKKGFLRELVVGEISHYHPDIQQIWEAEDAHREALEEAERIRALEKEVARLKALEDEAANQTMMDESAANQSTQNTLRASKPGSQCSPEPISFLKPATNQVF